MDPQEIMFKLKMAYILSILFYSLIFYLILHFTQWLSNFKSEPSKSVQIRVNVIISIILSYFVFRVFPQIQLVFLKIIDKKLYRNSIFVGKTTMPDFLFLIIITFFFSAIIIRRLIFMYRSRYINKDS